MKGYLQVYTGNGKGKTTAAIGLSLRAAGAGFRVLFTQFVKGIKYSEINALERFSDRVTVRQYGRSCFIRRQPEPADIESARQGLEEIELYLRQGIYDVVVLDEACIALYYSLFSLSRLLDLAEARPPSTEMIITGRYAPRELIERADLVTDMNEIKHYYNQGVTARDGIER